MVVRIGGIQWSFLSLSLSLLCSGLWSFNDINLHGVWIKRWCVCRTVGDLVIIHVDCNSVTQRNSNLGARLFRMWPLECQCGSCLSFSLGFQDSFGRAKKWVQELQRQGTGVWFCCNLVLWKQSISMKYNAFLSMHVAQLDGNDQGYLSLLIGGLYRQSQFGDGVGGKQGWSICEEKSRSRGLLHLPAS